VPIGLSPLQSGSTFEAAVQECQRAEALGFDSAWLGERHNHPLLYPSSAFCNLPSPQCAGCTPG
jgi:alkanesulfonate monooxygenase SsuD/methylene tetrahydromethanopterin reductase-like flavin-dependent oxidoreductase (luciferase family)